MCFMTFTSREMSSFLLHVRVFFGKDSTLNKEYPVRSNLALAAEDLKNSVHNQQANNVDRSRESKYFLNSI